MKKRLLGADARGYRCACEPAAVERFPVRTTARRFTTWLTGVRPVWFSSWLAAARSADRWRLLPGILLTRFRAAVLRRRSATVRPGTVLTRPAAQESTTDAAGRDHHRHAGRHRRTGDRRPHPRLVDRRIPERRLPRPTARHQPAADSSPSDLRGSRRVDYQEPVLQPDSARSGALQLPADQCGDRQ